MSSFLIFVFRCRAFSYLLLFLLFFLFILIVTVVLVPCWMSILCYWKVRWPSKFTSPHLIVVTFPLFVSTWRLILTIVIFLIHCIYWNRQMRLHNIWVPLSHSHGCHLSNAHWVISHNCRRSLSIILWRYLWLLESRIHHWLFQFLNFLFNDLCWVIIFVANSNSFPFFQLRNVSAH
jgi:hypothetical protein